MNVLLPTCFRATRGHAITWVTGAELAVAVVALYLLEGEHHSIHIEEEATVTH